MNRFITQTVRLCGQLSALCLIALLGLMFFNVFGRYVFNRSSIGLQEMEWHLFSFVFLVGSSHTLLENGHVRVDILYEKLGVRAAAWVDLLGNLLLALPFSGLIVYFGYFFARESFEIAEVSGDPGGLSYRWAIKGLISLSFALMCVASLGRIFSSAERIRKGAA